MIDTTTPDVYAAVLAERTHLDGITPDALRTVVAQWRVARAQAGDFRVGTRAIGVDPADFDPDEIETIVEPTEREAAEGAADPDEIETIVEPTEREAAEGAADACTFESGVYVLTQNVNGHRAWWVVDDLIALAAE